jgi:hypothetical protein
MVSNRTSGTASPFVVKVLFVWFIRYGSIWVYIYKSLTKLSLKYTGKKIISESWRLNRYDLELDPKSLLWSFFRSA